MISVETQTERDYLVHEEESQTEVSMDNNIRRTGGIRPLHPPVGKKKKKVTSAGAKSSTTTSVGQRYTSGSSSVSITDASLTLIQ